jgi:hypothetical protein
MPFLETSRDGRGGSDVELSLETSRAGLGGKGDQVLGRRGYK